MPAAPLHGLPSRCSLAALQFEAIFRRAFASRVFPPSIVQRLGIKHVKGILLYGPPGTGKTLIARQIGKMLNGKEPKVVNGPEVLNKYVGQTEENIRNLFAEADAEYKEKGDDSDLHIIIFDEIDAICKSRGSVRDGTGVADTVVNQLLTKIDGVDALNNILLIGMTNRKDMLDEALIRAGRLEVHIEVGLPDEKGRLQILKIHTSKVRCGVCEGAGNRRTAGAGSVAGCREGTGQGLWDGKHDYYMTPSAHLTLTLALDRPPLPCLDEHQLLPGPGRGPGPLGARHQELQRRRD